MQCSRMLSQQGRSVSARVTQVHSTCTSSPRSFQRFCSGTPQINQLQHSVAIQQRASQRNVSAQGVRRSPNVTPDISIGSGDDETQVDLFKYLLSNRIIYLGGYINDKIATQIVGSLLALEAMDEEEDIRLYINSPGGQPYSVIGIIDTIQSIKPKVQTLALGACYSYSSLLLAAGAKGKRGAMKNTRIMMSQPQGGSQGDMYQVKKTVEELNAIYQLICRYYMQFTGMNQDQVEMATCRDYFMAPEQALQEGLIDYIVRGEDDYSTPPAMVRQLQDLGLADDLTPANLLTRR